MLAPCAVDSIGPLTGHQHTSEPVCRICGASSEHVGTIASTARTDCRDYELRRCATCRYAFIADPRTDFAELYDDRYYAGEGADPLVVYDFELARPDQTIRRYEWHGITRVIERHLDGLDEVDWLDFGCGNGGLVRYVSEHTSARACGFEEGSIAAAARERGIRILSAGELDESQGTFSVVTAIEVLEHTVDPVAELQRIRWLLRPGGLLFLTTSNAAPFAERLSTWSYVIPEIHVSFFEPSTLEHAMRKAGFRPERIEGNGGFDEILKSRLWPFS
jgi:SAM-dependent methyltransferase